MFDSVFGQPLEIINCLYGLSTPVQTDHLQKVKEIIEQMGDKYLLAKPLEKAKS